MTNRDASTFRWRDLGNIEEGRPNLGNSINVAVYRLMQYTLREVITKKFSPDECSAIFRNAGELAGREFCRNNLDCTLPFNAFVSQLQETLKVLKIGILRFERSDLEQMSFVLTVDEDLDCSGLPVTGETVCEYDEGFLAGVLGEFTGQKFNAKEVDCWASGERTCRFKVEQL